MSINIYKYSTMFNIQAQSSTVVEVILFIDLGKVTYSQNCYPMKHLLAYAVTIMSNNVFLCLRIDRLQRRHAEALVQLFAWLILSAVFDGIGKTFFLEWNNKAVTTSLLGGVQYFPATAALCSRHAWVQLVAAADMFPEVELLAVAMADGRDVTCVCVQSKHI